MSAADEVAAWLSKSDAALSRPTTPAPAKANSATCGNRRNSPASGSTTATSPGPASTPGTSPSDLRRGSKDWQRPCMRYRRSTI